MAAADAEIQNQQKEFDAKKLEEMTEALGTGTSTPGGSSIATSEADTNSRLVDCFIIRFILELPPS